MNINSRQNILDASLRCLTHPLAWLAIAILLINDHLLKTLMPSWLTGKLSDFAGLFFFPFVLTALLSLPLDRLRVSPHKAGSLAILVTGAGFALIKTVPAVNLLAGETLSRVLGYRTSFALDPTDLLALSMLRPAWWLWKQPAQVMRKRAGWAALVIGAVASIASQPGNTPLGIVGLEAESSLGDQLGQNKLLAFAVYRSSISYTSPVVQFESSDGGLTWGNPASVQHPASARYTEAIEASKARPAQWTLPDPKNDSIVYRFTRGQGIERSTDSGNTWISELNLQPITEAQQKYYGIEPEIFQGPFYTAADPDTGNVIASMGIEGILVRTPNGPWRWIKVGDYRHVNPVGMDTLSILWTQSIPVELWLGPILAGLVLGVGAWALGDRARSLNAALILGLTGVVVTSISGSTRTSIPGGIDGMVLWMIGALSVASLATLVAGFHGLTYPKGYRALSISIAAVSMILFWLPFVLWTQNIIPNWQAAMVIAMLVALVMLALQYGGLRRLARKRARAQ